jgi:hypothetical protein
MTEADSLVKANALVIRERNAGERGVETLPRELVQKLRIESAANAPPMKMTYCIYGDINRPTVGGARSV